MKNVSAAVGLLFLISMVAAQQPVGPGKKTNTPAALQAEIEALRPAQHVWRAISWKTCPLEALKQSREDHKPIITWVFLGTPCDERC